MTCAADELPPKVPPLVNPRELRQWVLCDDEQLLVIETLLEVAHKDLGIKESWETPVELPPEDGHDPEIVRIIPSTARLVATPPLAHALATSESGVVLAVVVAQPPFSTNSVCLHAAV